MPTPTNRRLPKQARSRKRYNHILDTAAALFATHGAAGVTTNHIAAEADVAIGSLYQFFDNKEALIEALVERYAATFAAAFPTEIDTAAPIESVIRTVIGGFMAFTAANPGMEAMLLGLEAGTAATARQQLQQVVVDGIGHVLAAYYPDVDAERRQLCAAVSFRLVAGIMPLPLADAAKLDQMVLATAAYQARFMVENRFT